MSDYFFKQFYTNIKDPGWPSIDTYYDFLKLPLHIQQECIQTHKLIDRQQEIECDTYWQTVLTRDAVLTNGSLAFVAIPKCASSYYLKQFHNLGWKSSQISDLPTGTICFSLIQEPTFRYLKGITEWCYNYLLPEFKEVDEIPIVILKNLLIPDQHSLSYHTLLGSWISHINFIPMHDKTDIEIKNCVMDFCLAAGQPLSLSLYDKREHESNTEKKALFDLIKHCYTCSDNELPRWQGRREFLYTLLSSDIRFYRIINESFDPTWQKIQKLP